MTVVESTRTGNNGVLTAARLNLVGARLRVGTPWLVLAAIAAVTIAIALVVPSDSDDRGNPGLLTAFLLMVGVSYLQTMTQTFPFALSLGITRRTFSLGTGLVVLGECLLHAVALTVLRVAERATGGWGVDVRMLDYGPLVLDGPVAQVAAYAGPLLGLSSVFLLVGTVFKRWGQPGMYVVAIGMTLVFGGLAALATWLGWWPALDAFVAAAPTLLLTAVFPPVLALVAGFAGYLLVRRATP